MITDEQKFDWYRRRVKALEGLLACYRVSRQPGEKLFRELELTGQHVNHDGTWSGGDVPVESAPATCAHCGVQIAASQRSYTGWTHKSDRWKGVRCESDVTAARRPAESTPAAEGVDHG